MLRSIKDHPLYIRMKQLPPDEVATWVLGETPVEQAEKLKRAEAFRRPVVGFYVGLFRLGVVSY